MQLLPEQALLHWKQNLEIMKAIMYAGIGLFSAATVYGLADYYSSRKKGLLDKLYADEEIAAAPAAEKKSIVVIPVNSKAAEPPTITTDGVKAKPAKKVKVAERKIKMEDFSRARIPEQEVMEFIPGEPVLNEAILNPEKATVTPAVKVAVKEDGPARKISMEKFSGVPLKKPVKHITLQE